MLLSMFISFLFARKLRGKIYVLLMTVVLILVSLFSIGFPSVWGTLERELVYGSRQGTVVWQRNLPPIPLSFPFYADISEVRYAVLHILPRPPHPPAYDVGLYFLTFQLVGFDFIVITSHIILLVSFFLLVNFVGVILGYWISKTTFIDKLLKKG